MTIQPRYQALAALFFAAISLQDARAQDQQKNYTAQIAIDEKHQVLQARIQIPKTAEGEPLQSVYLQRRSKTGLDLHVPVAYRALPDGYEIYLIVPVSLGPDLYLACTLQPKPSAGGQGLQSTMTTAGRMYEIPLKPSEPK
jgi:hypothetical protein